MARLGLVLGAGGVVGQAYHAAVLAMLQHDHGLDARDADVIVGTSAGSITGALLRLGVSPADLAAWAVKVPLSDDVGVGQRMALLPHPELAPLRPLRLLLRPMRLPGPRLVGRAIIRPWQFRPLAAALTLLAPGRDDILGRIAALRELDQVPWPERPLMICAVRRQDGRRVVFGSPGGPPAPLHLAVAASCAVPGYFTPVRIGRHTYVDGGAHSPTNAAILRRHKLDIAIVVAPMGGPPGPWPSLYAAQRRHAGRLLSREVAALRAAGTRTIVFQPSADELRAMGNDFMTAQGLTAVVRESFLSAGAVAAKPDARRLLREAASVTH